MKLTKEQYDDLIRKHPNLRPPIELDCHSHSRKIAKLEPNPSNGALGKAQAKKRDSSKFLVRVTSVRKRLLDEDNLCEKYHVDLCRYAGIIPKDSPGTTSIKVGQRKAEKGEEEQTVIEIFKL